MNNLLASADDGSHRSDTESDSLQIARWLDDGGRDAAEPAVCIRGDDEA